MPFLILLLFIGLPIAEIAVLIKVADVINLWPTILLIILTAVIGVFLLRLQGLSSIARAQASLNEGRLPVNSITDAVALMLAGAFLLTPGLITDTLGFALLIPAVRHGIAGYLFNKARSSQNIKVDMFGMGAGHKGANDRGPDDRGPGPKGPAAPFDAGSPPRSQKPGPVIEGEVLEPEKKPKKKPKPTNHSAKNSSPWNH